MKFKTGSGYPCNCKRVPGSYKFQLPQTDPRDAFRHAHVLHTKVDAQCDKLATVVGRTKLITRDGAVAKFFLSPEFVTKFQSEVP